MKNNDDISGVTILIWGIIIFFILGYFGLLMEYGDKPVSEMPTWVWYLLK